CILSILFTIFSAGVSSSSSSEGDRYEHEIMLFEEEPPSDDEDEETPAEKIVNKIDKKQLDKKQLVKKQLARSQKHSLPDTGDEAYLASLVAMLAAAITVLISIIYRRRISRRRSG
ncbi:MAG: LPXTG cell wall anchor domain-containing protein, partial [Firmicutes bacterium]|nr:LPXTG cell wall anchor domain-containing protein [Bacillota bacterium]